MTLVRRLVTEKRAWPGVYVSSLYVTLTDEMDHFGSGQSRWASGVARDEERIVDKVKMGKERAGFIV